MLVQLHVFELRLDVLLGEDEHVELVRLEQVRALGQLLEKFGQQIASFFQEFSLLVAEALLFG